METGTGHKPLYIACIVIANISFITNFIFNVFYPAGEFYSLHASGPKNGTHERDIGYSIDMVAVILIYLWQAAWLIYSISTIVRRTSSGYIYVNPCHQTPLFYMMFVIVMVGHMWWAIAMGNREALSALVATLFATAALYVMLIISYRRLIGSLSLLVREGMVSEIWLTLGFTQNGLAINAAFSTLTALGIGYDILVDDMHASEHTLDVYYIIVTLIVMIIMCVWLYLDIFKLDRYLRYTLTPYLIFLITSIVEFGNCVIHWDSSSGTKFFLCFASTVMFIMSVVAAICKIVLLTYRTVRDPIVTKQQNTYDNIAEFPDASVSMESDTVVLKPVY